MGNIGKIWELFIPSSGHTGGPQKRESKLTFANLVALTISAFLSAVNFHNPLTKSFILRQKSFSFDFQQLLLIRRHTTATSTFTIIFGFL